MCLGKLSDHRLEADGSERPDPRAVVLEETRRDDHGDHARADVRTDHGTDLSDLDSAVTEVAREACPEGAREHIGAVRACKMSDGDVDGLTSRRLDRQLLQAAQCPRRGAYLLQGADPAVVELQ